VLKHNDDVCTFSLDTSCGVAVSGTRIQPWGNVDQVRSPREGSDSCHRQNVINMRRKGVPYESVSGARNGSVGAVWIIMKPCNPQWS
jgi:hypothetical protein